jgi:antitoxin (DNA-binding transcriptional repressor) of toxin-antitoxin stability system
MKAMTATHARQRLGSLLTRVLEGEDIGIVHSCTGKIIALRPVEVYSDPSSHSRRLPGVDRGRHPRLRGLRCRP